MSNTKPLTQTDLILLGSQALTARLSGVEGAVNRISTSSTLFNPEGTTTPTRANILSNTSFEFYDKNSTVAKDWTHNNAVVIVGGSSADGVSVVQLTGSTPGYGGSVSQALANSSVLQPHSGCISIYAKTTSAGQSVVCTVTGASSYGVTTRVDQNGHEVQSDALPPDDTWYRFYRPYVTTTAGLCTANYHQFLASAGTIHLDAAKVEIDYLAKAWLKATPYTNTDWGAATHIRNLSAQNITTGTLTIGGPGATNPHIAIYDASSVLVATIGSPTSGFLGIHLKNGLGIRAEGGGGISIEDGGSISIIGGGKLQVTGGVIRAGTTNAQRVDIIETGIFSYNAAGTLLGSISAVDGKWTITADALNINGPLILDALQVDGALTLGQDLIIGANVLFVDQSGSNIGINRVPDPQFDLDIAGNLRTGGYIVGRHALQIKGATFICHYDGPTPFASNLTGDATGHLGQTATTSGGVIYRPGKYGKGVCMGKPATNMVANPSAEVDTTYVLPGGSAVGTVTRVSSNSYYGSYCFELTAPASPTNPDCWFMWLAGVPNTALHTCSMWVLGAPGSNITFAVYDAVGERDTQSYVMTGQWMRIVSSWNINTSTVRPMLRLHAANQTLLVDGVQCEQGTLTPYLDGSLSTVGYTWAGTPHASMSTRVSPRVYYPATGTVNPYKGTICLWYTHDGHTGPSPSGVRVLTRSYGAEQVGSYSLQYEPSGYLRFYHMHNDTYWYAAEKAFSPVMGQTYFICATWDCTGSKQIYVDTVPGTAHYAAWKPVLPIASYVCVGSVTDVDSQPDGVIDDLLFVDRVLTTAEMRAIYESDAPVFAETSTWGWRTPTQLAWADSEGLWAIRSTGVAAFGVSGVDGKSWGNLTLDKGDVLIGNSARHVRWDSSSDTLTITGNVYFSNGKGFLDANGISLYAPKIPLEDEFNPELFKSRGINWYDEYNPTTLMASVTVWRYDVTNSEHNTIDIRARHSNGRTGEILLMAHKSSTNNADNASVIKLDDQGIHISPTGNVIPGNGAVFAPTQLSFFNPCYIAANTGFSVGPQPNVRVWIRGQASDSTTYAIYIDNSYYTGLFFIRNDGYAWVNQAWVVGSDVRTKHSIQPLPHGLAVVSQLNPTAYKKVSNDKIEYGFIAQEVQSILPDLVTEAHTPPTHGAETPQPMLGLDYTSMIAVLTKAVQELALKVERLERNNT